MGASSHWAFESGPPQRDWGLALLGGSARLYSGKDPAHYHGEASFRFGELVVVEAQSRRQDTMLRFGSRRPGDMQVELMGVHPHQASEKVQTSRAAALDSTRSSKLKEVLG